MLNIFIAISIFIAKVVEISLDSIKLIFMMKQKKAISSFVAFIECLIWVMIISGIITSLKDNLIWVIAYCGGYAIGCYIGALVADKLAIGSSYVQFIIPKKDEEVVINKLKEYNCGITTVDGKGTQIDVTLIISILPRKTAPQIIDEIGQLSKTSIFTIVSDINQTFGGSGLMK